MPHVVRLVVMCWLMVLMRQLCIVLHGAMRHYVLTTMWRAGVASCAKGEWNEGGLMTRYGVVAWGRRPAPLRFFRAGDGATFYAPY